MIANLFQRRQTNIVVALAFVLAGVWVLTLGGSTANASAPGTLNCNTSNNAPSFKTIYTSTNTFGLSPASVSPGDPVTVTWDASAGLDNASPVTLNAGTAQPLVFVDIQWSDTTHTKAVAATPVDTFPATNIPSTFPYTNTGPFTATTTVTAVGNGTANATVKQLVVNGGLATYCGTSTDNYPAAGDPTAGAAGWAGAGNNSASDAGFNGPYGASTGHVNNVALNGQSYQAFTNSAPAPVVIQIGPTNAVAGATASVAVSPTQTPTPEITLTKTAKATTFKGSGQVLSYDLKVKNTGNVAVTDVTVSDPKSSDETCPAADAASLAVGATVTCTATIKTTAADVTAGKVENTASASATYTPPPPGSATTVHSNDSIATVNYAAPIPGIALLKSANRATFNAAGDVINYSYKVTNTGEVTLSDVTIADDKIASVDCTSITAPIAPLGTGTCTASYTVTAADVTAGKVTNSATATAATGGIVINKVRAAAVDTITSTASSVTVNLAGPTANPTKTVTYPNMYCDTVGRIVFQTNGKADNYKNWKVTVTVSPAAAPPGDLVNLSVALTGSPKNTGPTTLAVGKTRFDATVKLSGKVIQLVGPANNAPVAPDGVIFPSQQPLEAKGTGTAPSAQGLAEVTLQNLWFNSLNTDTTGNSGALTGVFDLVCNTTLDPAGKAAQPIGQTVTFLSDPNANSTGVTASPTPTDTTTSDPTDTTTATSADTLPKTGGGDSTRSLVLALGLIQIGLIFAVRSMRSGNRRSARHA